jgi:hypothetical protein
MAKRRSVLAADLFSGTFPTAKMLLTSAFVLVATIVFAQQTQTTPPADLPPSSPASKPESNQPAEATAVTIPAGTHLALVLTHPVDSKSTHRGDEIDAQTTAPVAVGNQVVVPAGTFVQGKVEKLARNGDRGEFLMQSLSIVFPDGYVAQVPGPVNIESDEGTAWRNPSNGAKAGAIAAPLAGTGLGALIGSAAHTTQSSTLGGTTLTTSSPKGIAIGSVVGLAVGGAVALALLLHSQQFYVELGAPMQLTLPSAVTLSANQVTAAVQQAQSQPPAITSVAKPPVVPIPTGNGTCYTPSTPGTPPTVIPGTPAIGNSPGTPAIVIPGTPSIPGTPYPCP